jgi:hypothetical protein
MLGKPCQPREALKPIYHFPYGFSSLSKGKMEALR